MVYLFIFLWKSEKEILFQNWQQCNHSAQINEKNCIKAKANSWFQWMQHKSFVCICIPYPRYTSFDNIKYFLFLGVKTSLTRVENKFINVWSSSRKKTMFLRLNMNWILMKIAEENKKENLKTSAWWKKFERFTAILEIFRMFYRLYFVWCLNNLFFPPLLKDQ